MSSLASIIQQLPLFPMDNSDPPDDIADPLTVLRNGAALVLSVSGGKDSDAMSHYLLDRRQAEGWPGEVMMVHADLGRAEWQQTPDYVRDLARRKDVPLHVVRWTHGDLIDRIWQRYHKDPSRVGSNVTSEWNSRDPRKSRLLAAENSSATSEKQAVCSVTSEKAYNPSASTKRCRLTQRKATCHGPETTTTWWRCAARTSH